MRVGRVSIVVRYNCIRRDLYELETGEPFPDAVRGYFDSLAPLRGGRTLFVLDVAGLHRLTVAMPTGRIVLMPKLATERAGQRRAALALAADLDRLL